MTIDVLKDRISRLELDDVMGSDFDIAEAAWISRVNNHQGTTEEIERVLGYMIRHGHTSPFEMATFKFEVTAPLFVVRQWQRHRTWSYNEQSRRYTDEPPKFYVPDLARVRSQTEKQAAHITELVGWQDLRDEMIVMNNRGRATYHHLIDGGVAPEVARMVLPVSMYTTMIAAVDLHNLMRFIEERSHYTAQWEIRQYSDELLRYIHAYFPITHKLFVEKLEAKGGYPALKEQEKI